MKRFILRNNEIKESCISEIRALPEYPLMEVKVAPYKKNRTREQNDAFHAWARVLAEFTGYSEDEIKDKLVLSVWPPVEKTVKVKTADGFEEYVLRERKSTANLTVDEFLELQNAALIVAAKLGVTIQVYGGNE